MRRWRERQKRDVFIAQVEVSRDMFGVLAELHPALYDCSDEDIAKEAGHAIANVVRSLDPELEVKK